MPRRSKVFKFSPKLREKLDRRLVECGFGNYAGHVEWLAGQGVEISRSALHRYGQALQNRFAAGARVESTIGGGVRASEAYIPAGVSVIIVEPSTRKTWTYSTPAGAEVVRELIERAMFPSRKRQAKHGSRR